MKFLAFIPGSALGLLTLTAPGQVVINEIFYHAPDDIDELQWVELYNTTDETVNLSGWRLSKGVKFEFGQGSLIAPHGYIVVCKNKRRFQEFYKSPVAGEFNRTFKHNGERLELRNPAGQRVDSVEFGNRPPWPHSADGRTASLERICPTSPGNVPENWTGSPLSEDSTQPGGTPGERNAAYCASLPPVIRQVTFPTNSVQPGQPIRVGAQVQSKTELKKVELLYRIIQPGSLGEEKSVDMSKTGAGERYEASVPGQQAGRVVRMRLRAVDAHQAERIYPSPTEVRPALSCLVFTNVVSGKIPCGFLIHPDPDEAQSALRQLRSGGSAPSTPEGQARFMVQMALQNALDLPQLWAALTVSNCAPVDLEKLRPIFRNQERAGEVLEEKALADFKFEELERRIPELIKPFKARLGDSLKTLLNSEQEKAFESWRDAAPGGGPMEDPAVALRQFVRLEPDYLHLATSTNVTAAQLVDLRGLYRDAIQQREALLPEVRKLMSNPGQENREEGQKLQARAMAIPAEADKKLKQLLTPAQNRQMLAWKAADQPSFMRHARTKPAEPALGDSAFVLVEPQGKQAKLYDFVRIPERSGGWKVHFGKDQEWNGMTVADMIFEANERWVLAEPLAYDLYHRAGVPACRTDFIRLTVDGEPAGYHLLIEQVNKAFLRQNGVRDDGNLYKANWTGDGLVGQHDKHINRRTGHDDLVELVANLEKTKAKPDEQWALIRREFDVEEVLTHYAVRTLISDWDGFFNNYWLYHDVNGTGKWTFYPWDEDKTWGEYDGWEQEGGLLYNMPLTYGAEGDYPPGEKAGRPSTEYGFRSWWRAGGYISRPLLANPIFRKFFLARVKDLLNTEFTTEKLFPLVDGYRERLNDEVNYRAQVKREEPARAQKRFEANLASLKEFITKRRAWLLEQEEIRNAGPYDRAQLN